MDFGWSDREQQFRAEVREFVSSRWSGSQTDDTEGDDTEAAPADPALRAGPQGARLADHGLAEGVRRPRRPAPSTS